MTPLGTKIMDIKATAIHAAISKAKYCLHYNVGRPTR